MLLSLKATTLFFKKKRKRKKKEGNVFTSISRPVTTALKLMGALLG